ncbi:hypothetical protein JOB18_033388 [Solea senegalensis]|uniref:Uncharacterized protein n=1 Tax=Solea senegalensis TaxID=28829 RepID=A0AAV6PW29_SOLSE|nr:hypothetical protein JOB18_033388 [Solea senegalensis]
MFVTFLNCCDWLSIMAATAGGLGCFDQSNKGNPSERRSQFNVCNYANLKQVSGESAHVSCRWKLSAGSDAVALTHTVGAQDNTALRDCS